MFRQSFFQQQISEDLIAVLRQLVLLGFAAMVFKGQDHWVVWGHEGSVPQRVDHVFEENVCAHGHAVGDDWLLIFPFAVPAVEFYAPGT